MDWFTKVIDFIFGVGLFINAMLFVPQAIRIWKAKDAKELSLITFCGFCLTQLTAVIYGYLHHDYILMYGFLLALFTCGIVTVMGVYFRILKHNKNI